MRAISSSALLSTELLHASSVITKGSRFVEARFLQQGVDADIVFCEHGGEGGDDPRAVLHYEANIMRHGEFAGDLFGNFAALARRTPAARSALRAMA